MSGSLAPDHVRTRREGRPRRLDPSHLASVQTGREVRRAFVALPGGLIGMLVLVVAIEGSIAGRWLEFSDPVVLSWRFSDRAARVNAPGRDVLFLGDSLVKHGLIPSVFRQETGLDGVNVAAARAPALLTDFLLRRALDAGARPRAVIINTKPAVLIGGPEYDARYWPAALTASECLRLGWMLHKTHFSLEILTARLLPSVAARLEIRSGVLNALKGTIDPIPEINRVLWRNWTVNCGANVASLNGDFDGKLSPEIRERLHPDRWYVDPANAMGVDRLLKLARERRLRVFWLLPPISPPLQRWRESSGAEAKFEAFVRSYLDRYPECVSILDARGVVCDPSCFVDATHLSGRGAIVLSRVVSRAVANELERGPRPGSEAWITISPQDDPLRDLGPPLEDVDRSKEIIRGGKS